MSRSILRHIIGKVIEILFQLVINVDDLVTLSKVMATYIFVYVFEAGSQ